MNLILLESIQTFLPPTLEDIDLDKSIIIKDEYDSELIVGRGAQLYQPEGAKRRGGQPAQASWRNFLRAAVAESLGEGQHEKTLAFSAPQSQLEFFRGKSARGVSTLTEENVEIVKNTVSKIEFKHHPDEDWKVCNLSIREVPQVYFETACVAMGIPQRYKTYLIWQLGFGDWQQLAVIDGKPEPTSMELVDGIHGAYKIFEQKTGLSKSQTKIAWEQGQIPEVGGYNGKKTDASKHIIQSLGGYFNNRIGSMLNLIDPWRDRISHVVLAGGSSKDNKVLEVLSQEVEAEGLKVIPIFKIMEAENLPIKDPSFATILGLMSKADLLIDIGNSFIKVGVNK